MDFHDEWENMDWLGAFTYAWWEFDRFDEIVEWKKTPGEWIKILSSHCFPILKKIFKARNKFVGVSSISRSKS